MVTGSIEKNGARRAGWRARWLGGGSGGVGRPQEKPPGAEANRRFVAGLIDDGRYAFALLKLTEEHVDGRDAGRAWSALTREMALVPAGVVPVIRDDGAEEPTSVPAFYLDRHPVTNRQFERFVSAGCYDDLEIWPSEIWPSLMRFVDASGRPGPANWSRGTYPAGKSDHPVVGVCWYEALAYARWVGKRLPSAAEWQKAGGWPEQLGGGGCTRFPWGDLFNPSRTNLWASGLGDTAPVDAFPLGDTPNGIRQMSGNVWEWLEDPLRAIPAPAGSEFHPWKPMRRIIGGAFDTYLTGEATCHFITGQEELDRRDNIGFRCAASSDRLRPPSSSDR